MANRYNKYVEPQSGVVIADPYAADEEARKAEDQALQRRNAARADAQLGLAVTRENRAANSDALAQQAAADKLEAERQERARLEAAQRSGISDSLFQIQNTISAARKAKEMGASGDGIGAWEGSDSFRDSDVLSILGANADSNDMQALLNTVGSNTAFDRLQKMREESPTGGALGAVSEIELRLLRDTTASLSQRQSPKQFAENMDKIIDAYSRIGTKLQMAEQYQAQNGTMEGYTPPSEDEIASFSKRSAAGYGATEAGVPIPPEMQKEHADYLAQNWGNIDPQAYAQFRMDMDQRYGFGSDPQAYMDSVQDFNDAARKGIPAGQADPLAINKDLSEVEQLRNNVASSGPGTALGTALNAGSFGGVGLIAGDQLNAMREESPWWAAGGDIAGGITGTGLASKGLGLVASNLGGKAGAVAANPLTADIAYGSAFGAAESDDPVTGALVGAGAALGGNLLGGQIAKRLPFGKPADPLNSGERAIVGSVGDVDEVTAALAQAEQMGVPMTLADASPELGALAGSATRFSPTVAGNARQVMAQRNAGQLDRLGEAVTRDLGPIENIPQRSEDLLAQARAEAGPLYDAAYAAPGADELDLSDLMNRPSMQKALNNARRIALEEGRNPDELGFVVNDAGDVMLNQAGRFPEIRGNKPPTPYSVISGENGSIADDLITFVRKNGGLRDKAGELQSMGVTNARRTGVPMAGRDGNYGRLVNNDSGRSFDEMAESAWEAGYFGSPDSVPRPTEREFLDAFENNFTGSERTFSQFDDDVAQQLETAQRNMDYWDEAEGLVEDASVAAGPDRPFIPPEALGAVEGIAPSWQTLDYVKRGLDDVIEGYRDKTTGQLVLDDEGRAVNDTLRQFIGRVDEANPAYGQARAAYAGPVKEKAFLQRGQQANKTLPNQLGVDMAKMTPQQRQQMQLGMQSNIMDNAGNLRNNSNPWAQLNTPNTEARLGVMYGDDANIAQLLGQRDLELQLAGSANRLIGNSATAEREIADEFFKQPSSMGGDVATGVAETALLGGPWLSAARGIGNRMFKDRAEAKALAGNRALADEVGPLLLDTNPSTAAQSIEALNLTDQDYQAILEELAKSRGVIGGHLGSGAASGVVVGSGDF